MQARPLLLFVIVAVGLSLSWGLVGRKLETGLTEAARQVLVAERDCRSSLRPCAVHASDFGLVLGPATGGGLALRAIGAAPAPVRAWALAEDASPVQESVPIAAGAGWLIPVLPREARTLRLHLDGPGPAGTARLWVADFPL